MLHVELHNILPEDDAVRRARELIELVDQSKELVVVTRNGRPAVVLLDMQHLEELSGKAVTPVAPKQPPAAHQPAPAEAQPPTPPTPLPDLSAAPSAPSPRDEAPMPTTPSLPDLPSDAALPPVEAPQTTPTEEGAGEPAISPPTQPSQSSATGGGSAPTHSSLPTDGHLPPEDLNSDSPLA